MPPKSSPTRALNEGVPLPRQSPTSTSAPQAPADSTNNSRRRRPRKLNRPAATTTGATAEAGVPAAVPALNNEISALKSRMRDLESQVHTLYQLSASTQDDPSPATVTTTASTSVNDTQNPHRSPRRRGRPRGAQTAQTKAELARLEAELQAAQTQLTRLKSSQQRPRKLDVTNPSSSAAAAEPDADIVEEIPRTADPTVEDAAGNGRAVTLSGSYRIPLPSAVSVEDVQAIQRGVRSAGDVARSLIDASRASGLMRDPSRGATDGGVESAGEAGKRNWGEWFGGYSVAISRLVNSIEAEAAIEQTPGPARRPVAGRRSTAPETGNPSTSVAQSQGKTTPGKAQKQQVKKQTQRPPLNPRSSNAQSRISSEQINTLLA